MKTVDRRKYKTTLVDNTYYKMLVKEAKRGNKQAQEKLSGSVSFTMEDHKKLNKAAGKGRFMNTEPMRPCAVCNKLTPKTIPQIDEEGNEYDLFIHDRCLSRMAHDEDEEVI